MSMKAKRLLGHGLIIIIGLALAGVVYMVWRFIVPYDELKANFINTGAYYYNVLMISLGSLAAQGLINTLIFLYFSRDGCDRNPGFRVWQVLINAALCVGGVIWLYSVFAAFYDLLSVSAGVGQILMRPNWQATIGLPCFIPLLIMAAATVLYVTIFAPTSYKSANAAKK